VVFKADIHSWRFKRRVKSLARSEATAVRRMRRRGLYSVSEEIRKTGADPKLTVHLLKNSNQTRLPKWLQVNFIPFIFLMKNKKLRSLAYFLDHCETDRASCGISEW